VASAASSAPAAARHGLRRRVPLARDETGIVNVILWPQFFMRQRAPALSASLLVVSGRLQNQKNGVAHVIARRCTIAHHWLEGLTRRSRDFTSPLAASKDAVARNFRSVSMLALAPTHC